MNAVCEDIHISVKTKEYGKHRYSTAYVERIKFCRLICMVASNRTLNTASFVAQSDSESI